MKRKKTDTGLARGSPTCFGGLSDQNVLVLPDIGLVRYRTTLSYFGQVPTSLVLFNNRVTAFDCYFPCIPEPISEPTADRALGVILPGRGNVLYYLS